MRCGSPDDGRLRPISPLVKKSAAAAASTSGGTSRGTTTRGDLPSLIKAFPGRRTMARKTSSTIASTLSSASFPPVAPSTISTAPSSDDGALKSKTAPSSPPSRPPSPITLARMAGPRQVRGRRAASRRLALLLACTYAATAAGDAGADARADGASVIGPSPSSSSPVQQQRDPHESLGASFLRLVEESAARPTQWYYPATSDGEDDSRSSSSSSLQSAADDGDAASLATALFDGAGALTETGLLENQASFSSARRRQRHDQQPADDVAPLSPVSSWIASAGPENVREAEAPPHKPLVPPRPSDFIVFLLAALTLFAAAGGGIGGGTLFVPLFTVVGGFAPTNAVALSNVTVFGGAVANFLLNVRRPYARALRALPRNALSSLSAPPPLIDWRLILIMEPATLVGALAGGYVHRLLPSWLLLTLLSALLCFLAWQLIQKGAATYAAETREQQRDRAAAWANRAQADAEAGGLSAPLLDGSEEDGDEDEDEAAAKKAGADPKKRSSGGSAAPPLIIVAGGPDSSSLALTDDIGRGDQGEASAASGSASSSALAAAGNGARSQQQQQQQQQQNSTAPEAPAAEQDPLERLLKMPARVPYGKVAIIALLTLWMLGADTAKMRLPCGSLAYVLASLSILPLAVAITLTQRAGVLKRAKAAAEAHEALDAARARDDASPQQPASEPNEEQTGLLESPGASSTAGGGRWSPAAVQAALASHVRWTQKNSILYPLLSTIAGVCASMFGIGGGVVKGPLMLSLGVCPEVAAATSSTMILFTSAGASLFYFNAGFVQRDYALGLLVTAFIVTWAGQLASQRLVQTLGRRSIIVFVMAAMMVAAAVVAVLQSAFATRAAVRDGDLWDWGSICSRGGD